LPTEAAPVPRIGRAADFFALTKPRIVLLVALTTAVGFYVAAPEGTSAVALLHTLVGTLLVAAGASALNQVAESDVDGRMRRTAARPIPAGRLGRRAGAVFATALGIGGIGYLAALVNLVTAALAAGTLVSYIVLYTPLKKRSSLNTLIGAVPGALPILGGWAATGSPLSLPGWVLFCMLFLWQLPHFLALAWLYREDYHRAGLRMLTAEDPDGRRTFGQATLYAAALLPVSLLPTLVGIAGPVYFAGAVLAGAWFLGAALTAARRPTVRAARRLFVISIIYLPAALGLLALDKI
jgi:protoheme IX farnesyltransferase